jgi:hypothetical protein
LFIHRIIAAAAPGWQSRFNPPFRARQGLLFSAPNLGAGRWHSRPPPPPLKGHPSFSGNLRQGIMKGSRRPLSGRNKPPSGELRPVRKLEGY